MRHRAERALEPLAVGGHQAAGERRGAAQRDLLAEHRADRELVRVDVAGHPPPGRLAHERSEQLVIAERLDHAERVGIEVEQRARALHRRGQVAQVREPEASMHVPVAGAQLDRAGAMRQAQAAPVGAILDLLDAGHDTQA